MEQSVESQGWRAALAVYASVQFLVLTCLAILVYFGRGLVDPASSHSLLQHNSLRDVDATVTLSGRWNVVPCFLSGFALASMGIALVLSARNWVIVHRHRQAARTAGLLSQLFMNGAGIAFIGVALTPWNLLLSAHTRCVQVAFSVLMLAEFFLLVLQIANRWAAVLVAMNAVSVLLLATDLWMLFAGPTLGTEAGLSVHLLAQKGVLCLSVINIGLQSSAILHDLLRQPMEQVATVPAMVASAIQAE